MALRHCPGRERLNLESQSSARFPISEREDDQQCIVYLSDWLLVSSLQESMLELIMFNLTRWMVGQSAPSAMLYMAPTWEQQ